MLTMKKMGIFASIFALLLCVSGAMNSAYGQAVTATLDGRVLDATGGSIANATVTATNKATGFSRSAQTSGTGDYSIPALPAGDYDVSASFTGFGKQTKTITLQVGQSAELAFSLTPGQVEQKVEVTATTEVAEPTRTQVSTVITERQITNLPVNGREFISFALLSPAVTVGDTTAGSTDVIVEPVTKLSFAGQNIHFNFIAVDGADDISTASGIQRGTPPQEAVREFRVINTDYSAEFGRAVGGIVNIITKSGTNDWHGSAYEYFRNDSMDAVSILQASGVHKLHQNQYGFAIGGPIKKDKTFLFANYEGQRREESPFFNQAVLQNIAAINAVKTLVYGLPAEPELSTVLRDNNTDNGFIRLDHSINDKNNLYIRYFINDGRLTNQSPLNDGFDLPSAFKNTAYRDQSLAGNLASIITPKLVNELRVQFARRFFDFPTVTTQPHLEVSNMFAVGVNRGNPDYYLESRFEVVDSVTRTFDKHTVSFGGNFNWVRTNESFPLFYPFEADFASIEAFLGTDGVNEVPLGAPAGYCSASPLVGGFLCQHPYVVFMQRNDATTTPQPYAEQSFDPAIFQGTSISQAVREQAKGTLDHTYNGLYLQDKWRATSKLTLNGGIRWEWETWPSGVLNTQWKNFDPRVGLAYNAGTSKNVVFRAGFGLFHGIIPAPLLACQRPSCGGTIGKFPSGPGSLASPTENNLDAATRLWAFASAPVINGLVLAGMLQGAYPDNTTNPFTNPFPGCQPISLCGFWGDSVIVRFDQNHKNPYGIQGSLAIEFEPIKDTSVSASLLHLRGVHLGSFYNVNQPPPTSQVPMHDSLGRTGLKNMYNFGSFPGTVLPTVAVYFEANSLWDSVFDGLLINVNKRMSHNFAYGISYTYGKTIDDGPNPSFVLIPQDSRNFRAERAISSDNIKNRLVLNATVQSPKSWGPVGRDFLFGMITTIQSPMHFTKFAGFDANMDVFGNNDRVGIEPRNTFTGDNLRSVDIRISRKVNFREKYAIEGIFEAFNVSNTLNVRYFNTTYGAADFCPLNPAATGCPAVPTTYLEGSPNQYYGTPRAVSNPRQLQLAVRFTF